MRIPKEKYNTIGILVAVVFIILSLGMLAYYQDKMSGPVTTLLGGSIFFGFFLIKATFQIQGGYLWKNRVPWNNGIHRKDEPGKFWRETALELAFGGSMLILCIIAALIGWAK